MNPREIVLAQLEHGESPEVPCILEMEDEVAARLDAFYGGPCWRERLRPFLHGVAVVDPMRKEPTEHEGVERDPYGSLWQTARRPFHLETPALAAPSLDGFVWPDASVFFADDARTAEAAESVRCAREESFTFAWLGWGIFEASWGLRGFENALTDLMIAPDFYESLLDRLADQMLSFIEYTCHVLPDVDAIFLGDDWGDQRGVIVGPDRWRSLFKPRYARLYEAIHDQGKRVISHCCGSVADIMPDIIEIGLDVLESVQPEARGMNPYELKRKWGDKISFWGGLGSQSIIPRGSPAAIREEVRRLKREMAAGGGYILAPAKPLQSDTPTKNAAAVLEAFTDTGM